MFYDSQRIADKNRGHTSNGSATVTAPKPPWTPTVPTAEPWRSIYLGLPPAIQERLDGMSPRQRQQALGI